MRVLFCHFPSMLIQGILGLIYPPLCRACGKKLDLFDKNLLCELCYNNIKRNTPPFCRKCGKSGSYDDFVCEDCRMKTYYFDVSYSVCIYEGVIRECIHNFKYNARLGLEQLFKDLMIKFAESYMDMWRYDWLIPVPLHRVRHRERTFNQSEILAAHISKRFKISMLKNNLVRTHLGKPQVMLSKNKRFEDIKDSFRVKNPSLIKDKSLLLIDDVFTTGATVDECSKVLKEVGANSVDVLTLARGM